MPAVSPIRLALALAAAAAALVAPYVVLDGVRRIDESAGRDAADLEAEVLRGLALDPAALAQLEQALPPRARYDVAVSPAVDDVRSQAFVAWLGNRLLPRIRSEEADWVVRWGPGPAPAGTRVVRRIRTDPTILVYRR